MKSLALLLLVAVALGPQSAYAVITTMQNDSDSIELPPGAGSDEPLYTPDEAYGSGSANGNGSWDGGNGGGNGSGDTEGAEDTLTPDEEGTVVIVVGQNNPGDNSTPDALFNALIGTGGLNVNGTGLPGTAGGNGITISGSKLRAALLAKGVTTITVLGWDFDDADYYDDSDFYAREALLDTGDVAVIAAAAVFRDQQIEEVTFSQGTIGVTYRTKGWLLGFIPISFTVAIYINSGASTPETRVQVTYPWYRFLTWLDVSPQELAADINAAIAGNAAAGIDSADTQARLFTAVTRLLKDKYDATPH